MQIIESTVYGVRSALYHLESKNNEPTIALFPMIHLGEPAFYQEISRRLGECDLVLCEGVRSSSVSLLTLPYRMAARNPRLNLVTQQRALDMSALDGRTVHADVSGRAFEERLRIIPLVKRVTLLIFIPLAALYCRFLVTRKVIAAGMGLTLRKTRDEILADDNPLREIIVDWRDAHLIGLLEEHRMKPEYRGRTIGVLYGAGHMRAVLKYLLIRHDYRVAEAEWLMVFST